MDEQIYTLDVSDLQSINMQDGLSALTALESGQVVHFPSYFFSSQALADQHLLSEEILDGKHKNISFDNRTQRLGGFQQQPNKPELPNNLKLFMQGYANFARQLVDTLLPEYCDSLQWGRTSYRPAQILGRANSKRKDDTRLHVDAFSSTPVNGLRILRVFCNINPYGEPRVWHLGEPFSKVMQQFAPQIPPYRPTIAKLLRMVKATKSLRSAYDHYQLQLHDRMKLDENYQKNVTKNVMNFPAQSSWIVFTDHVSHAALSGQYLLEQTFYLPVTAMASPELSPLKYWENKDKRVAAVSN